MECQFHTVVVLIIVIRDEAFGTANDRGMAVDTCLCVVSHRALLELEF